jgi:hypothetical protein
MVGAAGDDETRRNTADLSHEPGGSRHKIEPPRRGFGRRGAGGNPEGGERREIALYRRLRAGDERVLA